MNRQGTSRAGRPPRRGVSLSQLMMLVAGFAVMSALVARLGATAIPLGLISIGAIVAATIFVRFRRRRARQESLLGALAVISARSMPLATGLEAFADQWDGMFRRKVLGLAEALRNGRSLPDALDQIPGLMTDGDRAIIRVGDAAGLLTEALRDASAARRSRPPGLSAVLGRLGYLAGLVLVILGIVGFLLYFIMPKYEAIFRDFGIGLPPTTRALIGVSHEVVDWAGPVTLMMILSAIALMGWTLAVRSLSYSAPTDRLARRRHSATIMRALATLVEADRPLQGGLSTMATTYPVGWVRDKIDRTSRRVGEGTDWAEALRSVGLLRRADVDLIAASTRTGHLAWALRRLADSGDRRMVDRIRTWSQVLFPLVLLAMAGVVAFFALAYFSPLLALIEVLSG